MRQVMFLKDFGFAEDGITTTHFKAGEARQVTDSCADSAIQVNAAYDTADGLNTLRPAQQTEDVTLPEQKAVAQAPANKAKPAPANKARKR